MSLRVVEGQDGSLGQIPPHDLDAEQSVLGALLLDPLAITRILDFLKPEDFYRENHKAIYRAVRSVYGSSEPIDNVIVSGELERMGVLERVGGRAHLALLQQSVPTAANVEHYAGIVKAKSQERSLDAAGREAVRLAHDATMPTDLKISKAGAAMLSIAMDSRSAVKSTRDLAPEFHEQLTNLCNGTGRSTGLPSGLPDLDRLTGGWEPGSLVIVAARPGMGKTSAAICFMLHAAVVEGKPAVMFSLEMSAMELFKRMVAIQAGVNFVRMHRGELGDGEEARVMSALGPISDAPIEIDDRSTLTEWDVTAQARRLAAKHGGLGLIVVDYLGLLRSGERVDNKVLEIANITRSLKALARTVECPVIALAQLNRGVEARTEKKPELRDLRDSGALEQDADLVMFIYRDDYYNGEKSQKQGIAELQIAKHRNGAVGSVEVAWNKEHMAFRPLDRRHPGMGGFSD